MMAHDSCHVRSMKRPAYKHRWDKKAAKRKTSEDSMRNKRWWDPAVDMHDSSRPAVRQNRLQKWDSALVIHMLQVIQVL